MNKWLTIAFATVAFLSAWSLVVNAQDKKHLLTSGIEAGSNPPGENRSLTDDERRQIERQKRLLEFDGETSPDHGESIDSRLMQSVKDNTIGVRYEEREAYLRVLRLAQEVPLRRQERIAAQIQEERRDATPSYKRRPQKDFPQFVDLFTHSDFYRGRPVTLRGTMRKLTKFDVGTNSLGLDQAYEGWVFTPDSDGNPAVVVFTSKDERLPVNGDIQEEVQFTGYYFKMYGYDAQDTKRKAPMIIAGEVEWIPHPYKPAYRRINSGWYFVTAMAFFIGCYMVWQVNRQEMPPRPLSQIEPDFNHMPPLEHPAPDPFLPHNMIETEDS